MAKRTILALLLLLAGSAAAEPVGEVAPYRITLNVEGFPLRVPYHRNLALDGSWPDATRAIVMVHGAFRNATNAWENTMEAAALAGRDDGTVIVIAPQFLTEEDIEFHALPEDVLFWANGGWKKGNTSRDTIANPRPARISSFAVVDSILVRLAANNPGLEAIVVAGHSAGGQLVNRFSAGSPVEPMLEQQFGVTTSYVVSNPSSYLYFGPERFVPGSPGEFEVPPPDVQQACPDWDDYKYGMQHLNTYLAAVGASQMLAQFPSRRVAYLLGEHDDDPFHPLLDVSCAANLQGSHRLERGTIYGTFLARSFGVAVLSHHVVQVVPGVGHSGHDVFTSACGVARLFDEGTCDSASDSTGGLAAASPRLEPNVPNPFRSRTRIRFTIPRRMPVSLRILDVGGRELSRLVDRELIGGPHEIEFGPPETASGVYWVRLEAGGSVRSRRLVVVR